SVTHVEAVEAPAGRPRPAGPGDGAAAAELAVLIVAHQTAVTEPLLEAVRQRARRGRTRFHLVVPRTPHGERVASDADRTGDEEAQRVLDEALPMLSEAAGRAVSGSLGDAEPLMAIQDELNFGHYDEVIISTLPRRVSRWLKADLVSTARGLGLPVTHVETAESPVPV
ncbi:MAG: hypothetical protein ACRDL5_09010, partial [Solirubrobacteraceae bacterium]